MSHADLIKAGGALLAIMNPFLILPLFLGMTDGFTVAQQRLLAFKIALYSEIMCFIVLIAGAKIIALFGITIGQFQIAGGLVLSQMGWSMVSGQTTTSHHCTKHEHSQLEQRQDMMAQNNDSDQAISSLAFFPMTFPILVGPATIATTIIYSDNASIMGYGELFGVLTAILLLLYVVLFFAGDIGKIMSETMRTITMRIMGTILLSIAIGMVLSGMAVSFPRLVTP